jgi:hypothetical protein
MAKIMALNKIGNKWSARSKLAGPDYDEGWKDPKRPWKEGASGGKKNFNSAMGKVISEDRYGKSIDDKAQAKYESRIKMFGKRHYEEVVEVSQTAHMEGYAPYHDTFSTLTQSERFPKGDPRNNRRVDDVTVAYHKKKLSLLGVT